MSPGSEADECEVGCVGGEGDHDDELLPALLTHRSRDDGTDQALAVMGVAHRRAASVAELGRAIASTPLQVVAGQASAATGRERTSTEWNKF